MPSSIKTTNLSALVIAYQRPESTRKIVEDFLELSSGNLYVTLDFPKNPTPTAIARYEEIESLANELMKIQGSRVHFFGRDSNVGCAASILSSIDWFFQFEKEGVILEDDCIPSPDFYSFSEDAITYMNVNSDVLLSCGTQFVPEEITGGLAYKSKYILTWGWATTSKHWTTIRNLMIQLEGFANKSHLDIERQYWNAGARRAYEGFVDVWDTVLVNVLSSSNGYSLLPGINLVTNIGTDEVATHTGTSSWVSIETRKLNFRQSSFQHNQLADRWLRNHFFGISGRHLITTQISRVLDGLFRTRKFNLGLLQRWKVSEII